MENCYLIGVVKKHYNSVLKSELGEKKVYFIDSGMLNAIRAFDKNNLGPLLENLIWRELLCSHNKITFFKSKYECEFVVDDKIAIQVCYDFTNSDTRKREIRGLVECCKYFNLTNGFIITFDDEEELIEKQVNIHVLPVYKFILMKRGS